MEKMAVKKKEKCIGCLEYKGEDGEVLTEREPSHKVIVKITSQLIERDEFDCSDRTGSSLTILPASLSLDSSALQFPLASGWHGTGRGALGAEDGRACC